MTCTASNPITTTGTASITNVGTAGTYTKVTTNAQGQTSAGTSAVLASSDFANQGSTTTLLHGNAAGNPSFTTVKVGADTDIQANITAGPSVVSSFWDLGTRSFSSTPTTAQVNNRVGLAGVASGALGKDATHVGSLLHFTTTGKNDFTAPILVDHVSTGGPSGSNGIQVNTNMDHVDSGAGLGIINTGLADAETIVLDVPTGGDSTGIGIIMNPNNRVAAGIGLSILNDSTNTNGIAAQITSTGTTTSVGLKMLGDGNELWFVPNSSPPADNAAIAVWDAGISTLKFKLGMLGDLSSSGIAEPISATKTSNYTTTVNDHTIKCDSSGGGFTVALSSSASLTGQILAVKNVSTSTNAIVLDPTTGNIDGSSTVSIVTSHGSMIVQFDGTNWWVLAVK